MSHSTLLHLLLRQSCGFQNNVGCEITSQGFHATYGHLLNVFLLNRHVAGVAGIYCTFISYCEKVPVSHLLQLLKSFW